MARFIPTARELRRWTWQWATRSPVGPTCEACHTIHGSDAAVAVGRFNPGGIDGYRSSRGGLLRSTRAAAVADYCAQVQADAS